MSLLHLRQDYSGEPLDESSVERDPLKQFAAWFEQMRATESVAEPTAMTLATADRAGRPSARVVLLKQFDDRGFVFFTNYGSRKGAELAANPRACLLFFWETLHRQVRIEGSIAKVPRAESVEYFRGRPRESQLAAWASEQSEAIDGRAALERRFDDMRRRFDGQEAIDPPDDWGGYVLSPDRYEFWQGRPSRMHDRIEYAPTGGARPKAAWTIRRLMP
jgi:pyridoxamine 5'-phosphate oxidase